jgi:hypothetical protein
MIHAKLVNCCIGAARRPLPSQSNRRVGRVKAGAREAGRATARALTRPARRFTSATTYSQLQLLTLPLLR